MSSSAPKIDRRTYEAIVTQTEALVEQFTARAAAIGNTKVWQPTGAQEVVTEDSAGWVLDQELAPILLKPSVDQPFATALVGKILGEDIQDSNQHTIATKGTIINPYLAQRIVDLRRTAGVNILIATRGTVIDNTLKERIKNEANLDRIRVKAYSPGVISVRPTINALVGQTLAQDIQDKNKPLNTVAHAGTIIDDDLAKKIVEFFGQKFVQIKVEADAGRALIRIFSRMATLVSDRLNQASDKNFLAFLNLIGTQRLPPQAARVPLTFSAVEGSPEGVTVPVHTQVAAPAIAGQSEEVVFETERDLVLTTAKLKALFVHQPNTDSYSDRTSFLTNPTPSFPVFEADQAIEHALYIAQDDLLMLPESKTVTLNIESAQATRLKTLPILWSIWNGLNWQSIPVIVQGLTVEKGDGAAIKVTKGNAKDAFNHEINFTDWISDAAWITENFTNHHGKAVSLVIFWDEISNTAKLRTVSQDTAGQYLSDRYIELARLSIDAKGAITIVSQSSSQTQSNCWGVVLPHLPSPVKKIINGQEAAWLRAQVSEPLPPILALQPSDDRVQLANVMTANKEIINTNAPFYPFGEKVSRQFLLLSINTLPTQNDAVVNVDIALAIKGQPSNGLALKWQVWQNDNGKLSWHSLGSSSPGYPKGTNSSNPDPYNFSDGTQAFTQDGAISFNVTSRLRDVWTTFENHYWLCVQIEDPSKSYVQAPQIQSVSSLPQIDKITAKVDITQNNLLPDQLFFNTTPIDFSKDFYPFGEQPHFNDTVYIASKEVFAKSGANVTVTVTLSNSWLVQSGRLVWEAWNGQGWSDLEINSVNANFTTSGAFNFVVPGWIAPKSINGGEPTYWIRARIVNPDAYGLNLMMGQFTGFTFLTSDLAKNSTPATVTVASVRGLLVDDPIRLEAGSNNEEDFRITKIEGTTLTLDKKPEKQHLTGASVMLLSNSNNRAPSLQSLTLTYAYSQTQHLSACQGYNDFTYHTPDNVKTQNWNLFYPFTPTQDQDPGLYLGFEHPGSDPPFANRSAALYAQVALPTAEELAALSANSAQPLELPRVIWEYSSSDGWKPLGALDETNRFAERGMVRFIGPQDFARRSEFNQSYYWLRARWENWENSKFRAMPRLHRILTNTAWSLQVTTIANEILGSSTGNPKQIFHTLRAPVLFGQQLEVQEQTVPPDPGRAAIEHLEGEDAIAIVRDSTGRIEAVWVRWHEVPDFYSSGATDRHYTIDRQTGAIQFGDGRSGLIPLQGTNNIRLAQYQMGGGENGNQPANTATQLKTTIPYVDRVINLEAAGGGADQEAIARVKERGPKKLRHRGRAVTAQDFEDLAYEASPEVARAKAIAIHFNSPGFDPLGEQDNDEKLPWLPAFYLPVTATGEITATLTAVKAAKTEDESQPLSIGLKLYYPGQSDPLKQVVNQSGGEISEIKLPPHSVTQAELDLSNASWQVTVSNQNQANFAIQANLQIAYPSSSGQRGEINTFITVPAKPTAKEPIPGVGEVTLLILPASADRQPVPSLGLIDRVTAYLQARCSPALSLQVISPNWAQVTVTTKIVPTAPEAAAAVRAAVLQRLETYLHPLTGGDSGQGWEFGQVPHESDLFALLKSINGVDHVTSLTITLDVNDSKSIKPNNFETQFEKDLERYLVYSGSHTVSLAMEGSST